MTKENLACAELKATAEALVALRSNRKEENFLIDYRKLGFCQANSAGRKNYPTEKNREFITLYFSIRD